MVNKMNFLQKRQQNKQIDMAIKAGNDCIVIMNVLQDRYNFNDEEIEGVNSVIQYLNKVNEFFIKGKK